jgi:hypothetical protein
MGSSDKSLGPPKTNKKNHNLFLMKNYHQLQFIFNTINNNSHFLNQNHHKNEQEESSSNETTTKSRTRRTKARLRKRPGLLFLPTK